MTPKRKPAPPADPTPPRVFPPPSGPPPMVTRCPHGTKAGACPCGAWHIPQERS